MIRNYFRVILIIIKKITIGNTQHDTRRPGDVHWRSAKGLGINTKIDGLMKKLFFKSNSPCITYLFLSFTGRTNIQKF